MRGSSWDGINLQINYDEPISLYYYPSMTQVTARHWKIPKSCYSFQNERMLIRVAKRELYCWETCEGERGEEGNEVQVTGSR